MLRALPLSLEAGLMTASRTCTEGRLSNRGGAPNLLRRQVCVQRPIGSVGRTSKVTWEKTAGLCITAIDNLVIDTSNIRGALLLAYRD